MRGDSAEAESQKNSPRPGLEMAPRGSRRLLGPEDWGGGGGGCGDLQGADSKNRPTHRAPAMSDCPCIPEQSGLEGLSSDPPGQQLPQGWGATLPLHPHMQEPARAHTSLHGAE